MLDFVTEESVVEILRCWTSFVSCTEKLICALEDISAASEFSRSVALLCRHGLSSVVEDHFLQYLEWNGDRLIVSHEETATLYPLMMGKAKGMDFCSPFA
ncbi:hypothetical protein HPP92_021689 [Vanilla planifolia]|uniref:Uncharacterized protein n=1 Tax=Vanilla planifolia TaxID=51239 RepID=A0A835Q225_VANPL|nr:hypothetical protein HPP92_021689 [Vanilla planifolia]